MMVLQLKFISLMKKERLTETVLGRKTENGEVFQAVIRKNTWFASEVVNKKSFALIGCTVSPGFDFSDFEMADRNTLMQQFPKSKRFDLKIYQSVTVHNNGCDKKIPYLTLGN